MVDNQHRQIPGYRDLDQETVDLIKKIKLTEAELANDWTEIMLLGPGVVDPRDMAMARTHFEDGFIRLVRAVAKPDSPWTPPPRTTDPAGKLRDPDGRV